MPSIAEIILQGGKVRAEGLRRAAEIASQRSSANAQTWGNTLNNVTQIAANIPQEIRRQKLAESELQDAGQRRELTGLQIQVVKAEQQQQQQTLEQRKALDQMLQQARVQDPQTGQWTYDRNALSGAIPASLWSQVGLLLDASDKSVSAARSAQTDALKSAAALVDATGNDPTVFAHELNRLVDNHIISENAAIPYLKALERDPSTVQKITATLLGKAEKQPIKLGQGEELRDPNDPSKVLATGQPKPSTDKPPNIGSFEDFVTQKYGPRPTAQQIVQARAQFEAAGRAPTADQQIGPVPVANPNAPHGEDYLKTISADRAATIKSLAEGRQPWPSAMAMRTPYWQSLANDVFKYDPTFDTATASNNARVKVRQDFTSGASAKQVNALNTVIGHLGTLSDAAEKMGNTDTQFINTIKNWVSKQSGASEVTNFETAKEAVASELVRVWRQAGGSTQDVQDWKKTLDSSQSPTQLRENIATIGHLLESKLSSMEEQYQQGMGIANIRLVTPESRSALDKLEGKKSGGSVSVVGKDGHTYTFPNQAAADAFKKAGG